MQQLEPATLAGVPLARYPHACAIVNDRAEEQGALVPFVAEGLTAGEQVFFIHGPDREEEVCEWIRAAVPDLDEREARGQFRLLPWSAAYLRQGRFDLHRMLELVGEVAIGSVAEGYPRSRLIGHMDWTFGDGPGVGDVIEYEARVNLVLAKHGTPAVCVYPVDLVRPRTLVDLLAVHPVVLLGGSAQVSPFFVPPDRFLETRRSLA